MSDFNENTKARMQEVCDFLLRHYPRDIIHVTAVKQEGQATIKVFVDHPDFPKLLDDVPLMASASGRSFDALDMDKLMRDVYVAIRHLLCRKYLGVARLEQAIEITTSELESMRIELDVLQRAFQAVLLSGDDNVPA